MPARKPVRFAAQEEIHGMMTDGVVFTWTRCKPPGSGLVALCRDPDIIISRTLPTHADTLQTMVKHLRLDPRTIVGWESEIAAYVNAEPPGLPEGKGLRRTPLPE